MDARGEPLHQLTGLRALAAGWVLAFHLVAPARRLFPCLGELRLLDSGYLGVDVFFVLSGFVLAHAYARGLRLEARAVAAFLWARFARVWPLHAAVTIGLVGACLAARALGLTGLSSSPLFDFAELPAQLALVQAWGGHRAAWNAPSWSVSAEWLAYLAFPFLGLVVSRVRRPITLVVVAALVVVAFVVVVERLHGGSLDLTYAGAPMRVGAGFTVGVLLERAARLAAWAPRDGVVLAAAGTIVLTVVANALGAWIVAPIALFVVGLARSRGRVASLLATSPFVWVGDRSYALYLVHGPVLLLAHGLAPLDRAARWSALGRVGWLVAVVGMSLVLAAVARAVVEEPARALLRRAPSKTRPVSA